MKAIWNDTVIAESDQTVVVEGNHYFPPSSIKNEYFQPTFHKTNCAWKGEASYYSLQINGKSNENAAWHYPTPFPAAKQIKDHVAFGGGVKVTE